MRQHHHRADALAALAAAGLLTIAGCGDDTGGSDAAETTALATGTDTGPDPSSGPSPTTDTTVGDPDSTDDRSSGDTDTGEPATLLDRIFAGIGGQDNLDALTGVELSVSAARFVANEGVAPGDPAIAASEHVAVVSLDLDDGSVRNEITRSLQFIPLPFALEVTEIAAANVGGWIAGVESLFGAPQEADMLSDRLASTLKQARLLNPHSLLKALSRDPSGASDIGPASFRGRPHDRLQIEDAVYPITLWVDPATDLVVRLTTRENSHLHRDSDLEVRYDDWQDTAAGVRFPGRVQMYLHGELLHDETRTSIATEPRFDATTFALPAHAEPMLDAGELARGERTHQHNQIFASIGIPNDGLQTFIAADEPAPGVHFLGGGSHHSVLVEQAAGLVMFEAPLYPQRCDAILQWIDDNLGGEPVTHVVVSHHHEDHSACARVMVAAGATLVVHDAAAPFFEDVLAAASTIEPDLLELRPAVDPQILTVPSGGMILLDDPVNPVAVYELPSSHASDMVLPFVAGAGVAFVVDIYSPGFPPFSAIGPQEVLAAFAQHAITNEVNLVMGGHGFGYATLADIEAAAGG